MTVTARRPRRPREVPIEGVDVSTSRIPTESPESDDTLEWNATTLTPVEARAGGRHGLGYTYADDTVLIEAVAGARLGSEGSDPGR